MARSNMKLLVVLQVVVMVAVFGVTKQGFAFDRWSQNGDATNCRACHGDFRAGIYISRVDGQNWGNLHNLHRQTMVSGDCDVCHGSSNFPVRIASSNGGTGMDPLSCVGCHGRAGDNVASNPEFPNGYGAGLRQHHFNAGVTDCVECHADADPSNYSAVGEDILPPYYGSPGEGHPNIPTDPCNQDGSENFAGATIGIDNDGDDVYDGDDTDCSSTPVPGEFNPRALLVEAAPNPFNPRTTIKYELARQTVVTLRVYDLSGDIVAVLVGSETMSAGPHNAIWSGRDLYGQRVPSGTYIIHLETDSGVEARKITLIR